MGIEGGFDVVPRLTTGQLDQQKWNSFLSDIKNLYEDDEQVKLKPNYILFDAGEGPILPFEGHKLLRFSSKISGPRARETGINDYIQTVTMMAKLHFGSRIHAWHEASDQSGYYSMDDVDASIESYEQPDEQEQTMSIASLVFGNDPLRELDIPLFEVSAIPGQGRGLVARINIPRGTRILKEEPLLIAEPVAPELREKTLAAKLKLLSKEQQRQFLSLHNHFPGKRPFSGIIKTNGLPCGSGAVIGAVYPTICLINHNCAPNSHNNWNDELKHETIHAIRPILRGEEITITYDHGGPSVVRQRRLKESFGFQCDCSVCSLPLLELQSSDTRRIDMQTLDEAIGDPFRMGSDPAASLRDCRSLKLTLEEELPESGVPHLMRLYYDAFQITVAHSNEARAYEFAARAYKARVIYEGEDSPETRRQNQLQDGPKIHASFGAFSLRWRTRKGSAPKGVTPEEFEDWLWRQTKLK